MGGQAPVRAEEAGLWNAFKQHGCQQAREALILRHLYLVKGTRERAVPAVPVRIDAEDLHSEGMIGLVEAVDRFDPARGTKFTSFAIAKIRGRLLDHLRQEDWVPRSVRTKERRGEPVEVIQLLSLESLVYRDDVDGMDDLGVIAALADPAPGPEALALARIEGEELWRAVSLVPRAAREVLRRHYWGETSQKQIARAVGKSETRVYQWRRAGLDWLRREIMQAEAREWTAEEEARLARDYGRVPIAELAAALDRSEKAVRVRADVMRRRPGPKPKPLEDAAAKNGGEPPPRPAPAPAPAAPAVELEPGWVWTGEQEEGLIQAVLDGHSREWIATAMGRGKTAVNARIARLRQEGRLPAGGAEGTTEREAATREAGGRNGSEPAAVVEERREARPLTAEPDPEIAAMSLLLQALTGLDRAARCRVMDWARARFLEPAEER